MQFWQILNVFWFSSLSLHGMSSKVQNEIAYGTTVEVWEWISNIAQQSIMDVIMFPCWD